jgi:serine/threonine-protein kinase HipA
MTKIKALAVTTPQGASGVLSRESQFVFNYTATDRPRQISLTMPIRPKSYASNALLPIFAMNRPEGFLLSRIQAAFAKVGGLDDMKLLSIVGTNQIGRIEVSVPGEARKAPTPQVGLTTLLKEPASQALFNFLCDVYLESGISGVQPKVLLPDVERTGQVDSKATVLNSDLIVKSGGDEYPWLTENEFLCMDAARRANIHVPKFWMSDDGGLFVMQRFDLRDDQRIGFEDMSVLTGKLPDPEGAYKYKGSYEDIATAIQLYAGEGEAIAAKQRYFEYVALSMMVRNGDAHMKNFGMLYEHPGEGAPTLAPLYDVMTTTVYAYQSARTGASLVDRTMALKLAKSKSFPTRETLLQFGADVCHVRNPDQVIDRIATAMSESLSQNRPRIDPEFFQKMSAEWDAGRVAALPNRVFLPPAPESSPEPG